MGILERRVVIIGLVVYIVLGVAAWFLLYQPRINARNKAAKEIAELRKELDDTKARIAQLPRLRQKKEQLEQEIAGIWARVVPRSEMLGLFRRISKEAEQARVHFLEIVPPGLDTLLQEEGPTAQVRPVPFLVTVQGRYLDIGRYIQNLNNYQYFVRVPDVDINARDDIRPEIEAKLLVNIYVSSLAGGGNL
ncbi:type 4a pilus biogenesis protein PilO [candidate division WOR-3 bacterium]|nr:type 4a pilus biogenesis protein PilO [candidate division WOR-3 bacterium]